MGEEVKRIIGRGKIAFTAKQYRELITYATKTGVISLPDLRRLLDVPESVHEQAVADQAEWDRR